MVAKRIASGAVIACMSAALLTAAGLAPVAADGHAPSDARDRDKGFVGWVQPEKLSWRPFAVAGLPEAQAKLLSFSKATGARSQITKLPAGWRGPLGYHNADEEIFLLSGDLSIGGKKMTKYSYAYYPAGYAHGQALSEHGATLLHMWDGEPDFVASSESRPDARLDEVIEDWNYYDTPWTKEDDLPRFTDVMPPPGQYRLKFMRRDKSTGAMTWINFIKGNNEIGGPEVWEVHPSWEEAMLLEGEFSYGECLAQGEVVGNYTPGGYFFRPAEILHGGKSAQMTSDLLFIFRTPKPIWADYYSECDKP